MSEMRKHIDLFKKASLKESFFGKKKKKEEPKFQPFGLNKFIDDFLFGGIIVQSMLCRMMENNLYKKGGIIVYEFSELEKKKLEEVKPLLYEFLELTNKINSHKISRSDLYQQFSQKKNSPDEPTI